MIYKIYDKPEEKGIDLVFDMENGMSIAIHMDDKAAQEMIDIIQNKLNARLWYDPMWTM